MWHALNKTVWFNSIRMYTTEYRFKLVPWLVKACIWKEQHRWHVGTNPKPKGRRIAATHGWYTIFIDCPLLSKGGNLLRVNKSVFHSTVSHDWMQLLYILSIKDADDQCLLLLLQQSWSWILYHFSYQYKLWCSPCLRSASSINLFSQNSSCDMRQIGLFSPLPSFL